MITRKKLLPVLSTLLSSAIFTVHSSADEVMIPYPENESVGLAMGWNMEKNTSLPNICIKNYQQFSTSKNDVTQGFKQGNNLFSLQDTLGISYKERVKASESAGGAGISERASGSESAAVSLSANFDMTKDNRYIVASQQIVLKWESLQSSGGVIELTDEAKTLQADHPDEFNKTCGSGYVSRIEYGGTFHALFNMKTSGYTETTAFQARLQEKSSGKTSEAVASQSGSESSTATAQASSTSNSVDSNVSIHTHESGATSTVAGTDVDSVLQQYSTFATRVDPDSATQFLLAVEPYPSSTAPLSEMQIPYIVLGREFAKWVYLDSLLNKIIATSNYVVKSYVSIEGVTLSPDALGYMQDMAQAKITAIQTQIDTCMQYVNGTGSVDNAGLQTNCSLVGQTVEFKHFDENNNVQSAQVAVEESDVYYLVRLPFSTDVYDGQIATTASSQNLTYQEIINNQVNGIYAERCESIVNMDNYCENATNVKRAVDTYVGNAVGQMYFKYKSDGGSGNDLCMSFEDPNSQMTNEECATATLIGFDPNTKQVKVRFPSGSDQNVYCIKRTESDGGGGYGASNGYQHNLSLGSCATSISDSQKNAMVYWEPTVIPNSSTASQAVVVSLRDTNYDEVSVSNSHTNCADLYANGAKEGSAVVNLLCKNEKNQTWQQILGQFFLESGNS